MLKMELINERYQFFLDNIMVALTIYFSIKIENQPEIK